MQQAPIDLSKMDYPIMTLLFPFMSILPPSSKIFSCGVRLIEEDERLKAYMYYCLQIILPPSQKLFSHRARLTKQEDCLCVISQPENVNKITNMSAGY
jgi:hypothetical protein